MKIPKINTKKKIRPGCSLSKERVSIKRFILSIIIVTILVPPIILWNILTGQWRSE